MENKYTLEEFSLMLFRDMSKNLITGLKDIIESAREDGLDETQEFKDFIQELRNLCN